jgi:hypothetical protein
MRRKYFPAVLALCLAAAACIPAYSDERLTAAFAAKDTDAVLAVLNAAAGDEDKKALEADVLREARSLVFSGDLDTASRYSETVLMFDFENSDAQDLYLSIEDQKKAALALEERKKADAAEAEKKLLAEEENKRVLQAQEEQRLREEKAQNDEKRFVESVKVVGGHNFSAAAFVSPVASVLLYASDFAKEYSDSSGVNTALRFPGGAEAEFNHPYVHAAVNARAGMTVLPFGDAARLSDWSAWASIGTPLIGFPLCVAGGVTGYSFGETTTMLVNDAMSPTVGLSLDHLRIGSKVDVSANAFWLAGSANFDYIESMFAGELAVRVKLAQFGKFRLSVTPAVSGTLAASGDRSEWIVNPSIYAGVIYNEYKN